jgi:hypothetical protein
MTKLLMKLGIQGMYLNIIKATHPKWAKTETISSKDMYETRVSTLFTLIQHSLEIPSQTNTRGRRNKNS